MAFRRTTTSIALMLAFSLVAAPARAQTTASDAKLDPSVEKALFSQVRDRLTDPQLSNRTGERLKMGRLSRLIEDLHVRFKTFERNSDGDLALGFEYDVAKSLSVSEESNASFDFVADGNVAFDRALNPDDFLSTTLRARWFGTHMFGDATADARVKLANELPTPTRAQIETFNEESKNLVDPLSGGSSADLDRSPAFRKLRRSYLDNLARGLPTELVWDADLHVGLESNQDFSSSQRVFGPAVSGRVVSWNPHARLSRLNVFDAPGAALRWLAGQDDKFRLSGEAYPTVRAGFDVVDASDDDTRSDLTSDDSLLRMRIEGSLKSHVLDFDDEALFLSARWRFYQEIDPSAAVSRADYDAFSHLQVRLDLPKNWSLSYTAGRLPLDGQDDSTFALGFDIQF